MTDGDPTLSGIDRLMEWARSTLDRVAPEELDDEVAAGAVVVDTRPVEQRLRAASCPVPW
jgi:hypothetical protein